MIRLSYSKLNCLWLTRLHPATPTHVIGTKIETTAKATPPAVASLASV